MPLNIAPVHVGNAIYYVLLNDAGVPQAQGSHELCERARKELMSTMPHPIVQLIDRQYEITRGAKEFPFRAHLGGSMIGRQCEREIWYGFRWAALPSHKGRILRLFDRGHAEEFKFVELLKSVGAEVRAYSQRLCFRDGVYSLQDWEEPLLERAEDVTDDAVHIERAEGQGVELKQWRIIDVDGHFGGSLDGISLFIPGIDPPEDETLNEFKTHNTASFVKLLTDGVRLAKPEHYSQMVVYMHKRRLKRALYMAVNKNDDSIHCEVVDANSAHAEELLVKARRIIYAPKPPDRIGNHASFFACKFCDFKATCHYGEPTQKSCRSCVFSEPVADGKWHCKQWNVTIPSKEAMLAGCDNYKQITD